MLKKGFNVKLRREKERRLRESRAKTVHEAVDHKTFDDLNHIMVGTIILYYIILLLYYIIIIHIIILYSGIDQYAREPICRTYKFACRGNVISL